MTFYNEIIEIEDGEIKASIWTNMTYLNNLKENLSVI